MQKSNRTLNDIFYSIANSRKILNEIDVLIEKLKEGYSNFYRNNIGTIDKSKNNNLEQYILEQNRKHLGDCTIKLENNRYVMQTDLGNNDYFYLPFIKNYSISLPYKDEIVMQELYKRYPKFTPLTKKQLLERVFEKNKNVIAENKITKKFFFGTNILTLASKLEELKIYDLSEALNFYRISTGSKTLLRRINPIEVDIRKSDFYNDYKDIQDRMPDLNANEMFLYLSELKERITTSIDKSRITLVKEDKDENFITKKEFEDLKCISIPQAEYMLDLFFDKSLDFKKIDLDIYKGILAFEKNINFTFYSPSKTLAGLIDTLNSVNFHKSKAKHNEVQNYNKNDVIKLN